MATRFSNHSLDLYFLNPWALNFIFQIWCITLTFWFSFWTNWTKRPSKAKLLHLTKSVPSYGNELRRKYVFPIFDIFGCEGSIKLIFYVGKLFQYEKAHMAPFYLAPEIKTIKNFLFAILATCHSVSIPLSGLWGPLVKIWGLSQVRLQFPKCLSAE